MPKTAKRTKLKAGEITYESLFAQEMKSDQPNDTNKSDLSQCTKTGCKILDIIAVSGQNNRQTMPITQPILAPLWHEPSNDDTTEKTMYYVRGTDVDLNKLDETGLAGGSDTEPQIVYKVVPNTHAHVIRYVMAEDDEPINENEILELVDISKDRRSVVRCKTGDSISSANIKTEKPEENKSTSPLKENTDLKDKCRVLELKCKWSDQKMAEMQAEMKKLKQEMMEIRQSQNPAPGLVQKQGQKKMAEQHKIIENRQIKEEAAWEEDDAEYLDVMMLDEEFVDDEEDDSHNEY